MPIVSLPAVLVVSVSFEHARADGEAEGVAVARGVQAGEALECSLHGGRHVVLAAHVAGVAGRVADVIQRIESARVDVAGLGANDGRFRGLGQGGTEGIGPHAALPVRGDGGG